MDRGLSGKADVLPVEGECSLSFIDESEGELDSLMFSALEKLHFFEGVLVTAGAVSGAE
jgi:hypothetical protein